MPDVIRVAGLTNAEFFDRYAGPGKIGLVGGPLFIDRLIKRAQRRLTDPQAPSRWAHAFVFQGKRMDGHHWLIESDLDIHRRHIRLGVQENRLTKYTNDQQVQSAAILDLELSPEQIRQVLSTALDEVAAHTRYSIRELAGTALAIRNPAWRSRENVLAQDRSYFCSAFVRHVFFAGRC